MIDLYYWPTPNGHKITIFLEESQLEYKVIPINIGRGEQFSEKFLKISPNNRMPAIVDHNPTIDGGALSVFESGAILTYLAGKTGSFIPLDARLRVEVLEWVFWQMGGLGPMAGQNHHFVKYAPKKIPYAIDRYVNETSRLYAVLDKRLANMEYVVHEYTIADMIIFPWIFPHERQKQDLNDFPNLKRWFLNIKNRPAVVRAYELGKKTNNTPTVDEKSRDYLFGQGSETVRR